MKLDQEIRFNGNKVAIEGYRTFLSPDFLDALRLDCDFYAPIFLQNDKRLRRSGNAYLALRDIALVLSDGTHDTIDKLGGYQATGYRLITSGEVANGFDSPGVFITEKAHLRNKRSEVLPGDLLIAVRGSTSIGISRVYPTNAPIANINTAVARLRIHPEVDSYWVSAFLNSFPGRMSTLRVANGVNQLNMNMEEVGATKIILPDHAIQRAIGNKVRKAERLREMATTAISEADTTIKGASFADPGPNVKERPRWFGTSIISPVSLNAEFNRTMEAQSQLDQVLPFVELIEECRAGDPIASTDRRPGPYLYYGASGPIDWHDSWNTEGERILVAQDGTIGMAVVANGRYWANNHVWICKLKANYSQRAVARFMTCFYPFWDGLRTGSVVPKITSENLERLCVPVRVATASDVGVLLEQAEAQETQATSCIDEARAAVNSLIDDTLDEQALLAESEAIEQWLAENPIPHETEKQ